MVSNRAESPACTSGDANAVLRAPEMSFRTPSHPPPDACAASMTLPMIDPTSLSTDPICLIRSTA
jgi:hypothetical protein